MSIRVLLADDHDVVRKGLCALLEGAPDVDVVGGARNGREAVAQAAELRPDVVVMDVAMPELNGILATRQIRADDPNVKVVALSMHGNRTFVRQMLGAGAGAYLVKTCKVDELLHAIRVVNSNRTYLSPEVTGGVVEGYFNGGGESSSTNGKLTVREREVLQLLAEGQSSKEIAQKLSVSVKTITTHRQNIMDKLQLRSVAELTKFAIREGLTSLEA